jgi:hypothetical protein
VGVCLLTGYQRFLNGKNGYDDSFLHATTHRGGVMDSISFREWHDALQCVATPSSGHEQMAKQMAFSRHSPFATRHSPLKEKPLSVKPRRGPSS